MIAEPHKPDQSGGPEDKIAGGLKQSAIALAALELLVYWVLVIRFPAAMAPLSAMLGVAAWYFRRQAGSGQVTETIALSERDLVLVEKYCKTWIYIAAYGTAFALFLLLRG